MSFNDAVLVFVKEIVYRIHSLYLSKDEAINMMNNTDLKVKSGPCMYFSPMHKT